MNLHRPSRAAVARVSAYVGIWVLLSTVAFLFVLANSSRQTTFLSHEATITPSLSLRHPGQVTVHTGPVLPDVRIPSGAPIAVEVTLGKTTAASVEALVDRYAYLASSAAGERAKLTSVLRTMVVDAAIRAAVLGAIPLVGWRLLGARRRRELVTRLPSRRGIAALGVATMMALAAWQPWAGESEITVTPWTPLPDYLGEGVDVPAELRGVSISGDVSGTEAKRLIESMISSYTKSRTFYDAATVTAAGLGPQLRAPTDGDTVVLVVTDRHDNIGMDSVARAVGDAGGATAVYDLGDDTSTGSQWEAFSLDSVTSAFHDLDRWAIAGNHDQGSFVATTMDKSGWTVLSGEVVDGPGDATVLGQSDPRSSGLGDWREQKGITIAQMGTQLADTACAAEKRVSTLLVHDANAGKEALARGCVDLVLAGHVHLFDGPNAVTGANGKTGWSFTTGTTGGAAYAFALGSKPRREAGMSLVTYRNGVPIGVQAVRLASNGKFGVDPWAPLNAAS